MNWPLILSLSLLGLGMAVGTVFVMMTSMPLPNRPRVMVALTGPVIGVVSGAVLGLFALVATKLTRTAART